MSAARIKGFWWCLCSVVYIGLFITAAGDAYRRPFLNWDMVAYIGIVESFSAPDTQTMYSRTLAEVKKVDPPELYDDLTHGDFLSNNATAFHQQLPFYTVKPLYTGGIWLLHALGMALPEASYVLSIAGFLLLGAICYYFVPSTVNAGLWCIIIALFCTYGPWPMAMVAELSTPDTICTALSVAGFCLWFYRRSFAGFAACFVLAQLARPDTLLLSSALAMFFTRYASPAGRWMTRKQGVGFVAAAVILYVTVNIVTGNYGWKALFYYTFINKTAYPALAQPAFGLAQYWDIFSTGVVHMAANGRLQCLLAASAVASACYPKLLQRNKAALKIIWLLWLVFALRFALFPAWWEDRYYYPYYFILLFALAEVIPHAFVPNLIASSRRRPGSKS